MINGGVLSADCPMADNCDTDLPLPLSLLPLSLISLSLSLPLSLSPPDLSSCSPRASWTAPFEAEEGAGRDAHRMEPTHLLRHFRQRSALGSGSD